MKILYSFLIITSLFFITLKTVEPRHATRKKNRGKKSLHIKKSNPRLEKYYADTQKLINELDRLDQNNQCPSCQILIEVLFHQLQLSFDMMPLFGQFTQSEEITCRALDRLIEQSKAEQALFKQRYIHPHCTNDLRFVQELNTLAEKIFAHNRNARSIGCKIS